MWSNNDVVRNLTGSLRSNNSLEQIREYKVVTVVSFLCYIYMFSRCHEFQLPRVGNIRLERSEVAELQTQHFLFFVETCASTSSSCMR